MRFPLPQALIASFSLFFFVQEASAAATSITMTVPAKRIVTQELTIPATGVALSFTNDATVELQTKESGQWSIWRTMRLDGDAKPLENDSELLFVNDATAVRLRSDATTVVTLHTISVEPDLTGNLEASAAGRGLTTTPIVIPRWQWGANEKLRVSKRGASDRVQRAFYTTPDLIFKCDRRAYLYPDEFRETKRQFLQDVDEDGKEEPLLWPLSYSERVQIIVVHHTAESSPASLERSDIERMRTVYEYHAVSRGWGDIGYNYVIGPSGMIFEGRAGGDYAVGAHAFCNNVGSMGIALMGNFQENKPTDVQMAALRWLLVHLTDKYKIDPNGEAIYHGKATPTIIGHRDVGQTACPGTYSYELLPQVRYATEQRTVDSTLYSTLAAPSSKEEAALMESPPPLSVVMGGQETIVLKFMNVGTETWDKDTWLLADQHKTGLFFTRIRPYSFVAATMKEPLVRPGEIATFEVELQAGLSERKGITTLTPVINNERKIVKNSATLAYHAEAGAPRFTYVTSYLPPLHKTGEDLTGTIKLINAGAVPWKKDSITEIRFDLEGGTGEVSILSQPEIVGPGEQGSFRISLQNVEEAGPYKRSLIPRFLEGSPLTGNSILIASRAEPIPDLVASSTAYHSAASATHPLSVSPEMGGAILEAVNGAALTLPPKGQGVIDLRLRTGKSGVARYQDIAPIVRSNPTIVLTETSGNLRVRETLRAPLSLKPYESHEFSLTIRAPKNEGEYTFSIGELAFTLSVRPKTGFPTRVIPSTQKVERSLRQQPAESLISVRRARRSERKKLEAPPVERSKEETDIRIRLSYDKDSAIITSPSTMRIEGRGGIVLSDGPTHLSREQELCKVTTSNGNLTGDALRFAPADTRSFLTIMTQEKSTNRFRGVLECRVIDGKLTLINELGIEDYLAGLAEEPDSEPWEKQRAFAIAARSYALHYVLSGQRKFPGKPYDGSDSPREFQAYGGLFFEEQNPRWVQAVRDTAGRVVTWQRRIVKAPYFSSDSGQTKSALEVWGWKDTPYLESKPDPWCSGMSNNGHGVGMSGCGAEGQANEGKTAEQILGYYYPNTHILSVEKAVEWEARLK